MVSLRRTLLLAAASAVAAYQWPNPRLDALEALRWDQDGAHSGALGFGVNPCNQFVSTTPGGQTNAAQWLRTAYHDVSTYDVETGTGGLDGSIQFEMDRPENAGSGFSFTLFTFVGAVTGRYISVADGIAAAALFAVEACGGPQINFRAGRIDAQQAGPPGVPQPQESLQSHTTAFARMGFTPTEMIQLVACGHTIGGVQKVAFPDIVPATAATSANPDGNMAFDQTPTSFDNHIAVEYVTGQTINPLVTGPNVTTQSDARIFASDGNVTMKALADSPSLFSSTCASLLERMLNTVPREVVLTEIIDPLPVKPADFFISRSTDGSFTLTGNIRFWNLGANSDASVHFLWADDSGKPCANCSISLVPMQQARTNVGIAFVGNHTALWFQLPAPGLHIGAGGISRFWFEVTENGKTWVEDQQGLGFPLQTSVVVADTSCASSRITTGGRVDIAIRKGLQPSLVYLEGPLADDDGGFPPGMSGSWPAALNATGSASDTAYDIYSLLMPRGLSFEGDLNVGATIDGHNITDWTSFAPLSNLRQC